MSKKEDEAEKQTAGLKAFPENTFEGTLGLEKFPENIFKGVTPATASDLANVFKNVPTVDKDQS